MLIREYRDSDRVWAEPFMQDVFGGPLQARRGELLDVLALPGFVAERAGRPLGLLTYRLENDECELAFIAALERHRGVGTALLDALVQAVAGCERIWLVTTNDNLEALRFYQRRGFVLSALRPGAVDEAREKLKPQISTFGEFGIPLRDEIELELRPEPHDPKLVLALSVYAGADDERLASVASRTGAGVPPVGVCAMSVMGPPGLEPGTNGL